MSTALSDSTEPWPAADNLGLPVDTAAAFSNHKNVYKKRIERQQRKLLTKISFLTPFLDDGEKILRISTACSPIALLEQLFGGGLMLYYLKRCLLVFTTQRIFHIPTTGNYTYRQSIAEIPYAACEKLRMRGATLTAKYKSGKTEKFLFLKEHKKVKQLLNNLPLQTQVSTAIARTHLCPRCTHPLVEDQYHCPVCNLEFKNKKQAVKHALIFPGGGYFYTRNTALGIMNAIGETIVLVLLLMAAFAPSADPSDPVGLLEMLIIFAVVIGFEKMLTIFHAHKFVEEFIPKEKTIRPSGQEQPLPPAQSQPRPEDILSASWRSA